jgi:hypothetical protein
MMHSGQSFSGALTSVEISHTSVCFQTVGRFILLDHATEVVFPDKNGSPTLKNAMALSLP